VADDVLRSVVTIVAAGSSASGTGSGSIINRDGMVLTNNHVVSVAANGGSLKALLADGQQSAATIVGRDPLTDLAVIKLADTKSLIPIAMGSSADLAVGQPVIALGAPLGLASTVTTGIVSALDRTIRVPSDNDSQAVLIDAIQTDAAINPGNSGGALVNCSGQLVGVPSAGASVPNESGGSSSGSVGLGFAIPVDFAKTIAAELIENGKVTHATFGIAVQTASEQTSSGSSTGSVGLYISEISAGGPAAAAGLRVGDVLTKVDGETATIDRLTATLLRNHPGASVSVTYERGGKAHTAKVKLAAPA
jgi:putative serine protease PepD